MPRSQRPAAEAENELGARLRALRAGRGLSLRALSTRSGVTAGALSLIENSRNSPSVSTLKKVLAALDLTLGEFFADGQPAAGPGGVVIRARQLVNVATGPGLQYLLPPGPGDGRAIQIMHEIYAPGADTGPELYTHAGEEAGFCVAGAVEVTVDGRRELLRPGDAFYFSSDLPHRWRNAGGVGARMITACTPPTF